jgi:hypothetical protein
MLAGFVDGVADTLRAPPLLRRLYCGLAVICASSLTRALCFSADSARQAAGPSAASSWVAASTRPLMPFNRESSGAASGCAQCVDRVQFLGQGLCKRRRLGCRSPLESVFQTPRIKTMSKDKTGKKDKLKKYDLFSIMMDQSAVFRDMVTRFQSTFGFQTSAAETSPEIVERPFSRSAKTRKAAKTISRVKPAAEAVSSRKPAKAAPVRASTKKVAAKKSAPAKKVVRPATKKAAAKPVRKPSSRKAAASKK